MITFTMGKSFSKQSLSLITLFLISIEVICTSALASQEAIGFNLFDLARANAGSPSCWGDTSVPRCDASVSGSATFTRCNSKNVPVNMSEGTGSLVFTTTRPSSSSWKVVFKPDWGHSVNFLRYGNDPLLHLRLRWTTTVPNVNLYIRFQDDTWINNLYRRYNGMSDIYSNQTALLYVSNYLASPSTSWQDVYIPLADFVSVNGALDLTRISAIEIGSGSSTGSSYSSSRTMYIEKIKVIPSIANQYPDMIKINHFGYLPVSTKLLIVSHEPGALTSEPTYFEVRDSVTDELVYTGRRFIRITASDDQSGDYVLHGDFTDLTTPGKYYITCPEIGQTSVEFEIRKDVYDTAFRDALRFFYFARSGLEIVEPYAEGHPRPAIYTSNSASVYDYDDNAADKYYDYDPGNTGITTRDVQGGWFDAGDLHMDVHNNVIGLWQLMQIYDQFKNKIGPGNLNLPESDATTNDMIPLMKWGLDWMKKMQNSDGSVHFIVYAHSSPVDHQHVSDVSTGSACITAGIFAKAYTILSTVPGYEDYAADLLARAQMSWNWMVAHPANYNPVSPGIGQWSYSINDDTSFRSFAAIELYIATGTSTYRTFFETAFSGTGNPVTAFPGIFGSPGASGSSGYYEWVAPVNGINGIIPGYFDYVNTTRPVTESIRTAIRNGFITSANQLVYRSDGPSGTYRLPMHNGNDLYWGSSGLFCANSYLLIQAYKWTGTQSYREAAADALHWICGRNTVNRNFITGNYDDYLHGTDHYSFYMFDHLNPVPGYLCGNVNMLSGYVLQYYIKYPWKYYLNIQTADFLEPCLPWQANLCYLLGYFADDLKLPQVIDTNYLLEFSNAWLTTPADAGWNPNCDIALPTDQVINFLDFAVLANQWMEN